jgi:ATP-dependent helicase/DNAse subunit B
MVQIIAGRKGKGKTKYLLDMANTAVKEAKDIRTCFYFRPPRPGTSLP